MNTKTMSREEKRQLLDEIFVDDPLVVKEWLNDLVNEKGIGREEKIRRMINEDFEEYAEVFKALA